MFIFISAFCVFIIHILSLNKILFTPLIFSYLLFISLFYNPSRRKWILSIHYCKSHQRRCTQSRSNQYIDYSFYFYIQVCGFLNLKINEHRRATTITIHTDAHTHMHVYIYIYIYAAPVYFYDHYCQSLSSCNQFEDKADNF